jgi:hypothetical protein
VQCEIIRLKSDPPYGGFSIGEKSMIPPPIENWFVPSVASLLCTEEARPVTLHIILSTSEQNSMVWVTDMRAGLGFDNTADVEKVIYLKNRNVACSAWGDHSFTIRDEFVRWIQQENLNLSSPTTILESLRNFVQHFRQLILPGPNAPQGNPGLILVTFSPDGPKVYFALFAPHPVASPVEQNLWAGDDYSPAKIFADYYYALSRKTVEDALLFGIHAMRLAHQVKASYIGEPNAWVYRDGKFERLSNAELAEYIKKSKSIDSAILNR